MKSKEIYKAIISYINKRRVKRYYIEQINNGKTYIAALLDTIFFRILLTVLFLVYFFYMTRDILFSILLSLQLIVLFSLISYKVKSIRLKKAIDIINREIAKEQILKDLLNKTQYEFIELIKTMFEKGSFDDLRVFHQKDIDLLGNFNGNTVGIKCFQYNKDSKVDIKDIREFFLGLKELNVQHGFIVTTSSFSDNVNDFLPRLEKYAKIRLIDLNSLMDMMKKAGLYPSEREIQKVILERINERRQKIKEYSNVLLSKGKTFKYFFVGIVIYFWGRITPYPKYYSIVSYVLFLFGLISLGVRVARYITEFTKSSSDNENEII